MRAWKLGMFTAFGIFVFSGLAFADNSWTPADGNQCDTACRKVQKFPIAVGRTTDANQSFVCSAEGATGSNEPGLRAGFTTKSDHVGCAIYSENGFHQPLVACASTSRCDNSFCLSDS